MELIGNPTGQANGVIFQPKQTDANSLLKNGTTMSLLFVVQPTFKGPDASTSPIFTRLGSVRIKWKPTPIPSPGNVQVQDEYKGYHGPLVLSDIGSVVYAGPRCYVEEIPMAVYTRSITGSPKVMIPFDVEYQFVNKKKVYQKIRIQFQSFDNETKGSIVIAGVSSGEIHLGPLEEKSLIYTMLALKAGKVVLPVMNVSSDLCQSWFVHGGRETIILP